MSGPETTGPGNRAIGGQSSQPTKEPVVDVPTAGLSNKQLRTRNRIRSPLLRLPYELSTSCFSPSTTRNAPQPGRPSSRPVTTSAKQYYPPPQLWERIYCLPPEKMLRRFEMANWRPAEIYAHWSRKGGERVKAALDSVRDAGQLRRDRIHTLEFQGVSDVWPHFSWVLDEPFPNLEHLTISIEVVSIFHIPLTVSVGKHLETLSIDNVSIPASSHLFHNLKNLHVGSSLNYNSWPVTMNQLITILNASPRLETLSLVRIRPSVSLHEDGQSGCVATLFHLKSLALTAPASEVVSIMDHLHLPSIISATLDLLGLQSHCIRLIFPNDILTNHLSKVTHNFPHSTQSGTVRVGSLQLVLGTTENRENLFSLMCRMVLLSVTELEIIRDMFNESRWREFAHLRPGVCSISSYYDAGNHRLDGLWRALLPDKSNPSVTLFPNLESVTLKAEHLSMIPPSVLGCLRMRGEGGFKLKRLEVQDTGKLRHAGRQPGEFQALADVFVYCEVPIKLQKEVDV